MLKDTMEHIVQLSVPLVVDIHSGTNWGKSKVGGAYMPELPEVETIRAFY